MNVKKIKEKYLGDAKEPGRAKVQDYAKRAVQVAEKLLERLRNYETNSISFKTEINPGTISRAEQNLRHILLADRNIKGF